MQRKSKSVFDNVPAFDDETKDSNVIIDTPKNSRNKYKFDEKLGLFKLGGVLAVGHFFRSISVTFDLNWELKTVLNPQPK